MNFLKALNWRYAVQEFSTEVIASDALQQLLDATRLSASSYGLQPYHLIVIRSPAIKQQLATLSLGQEKVRFDETDMVTRL